MKLRSGLAARRHLRRRRRRAAGRRGGRRRDRLPSALGERRAQGRARLRARRASSSADRGARDRLRRPRRAPRRARRAYERLRRRRGDDRPRLARLPVDLRGADRRPRPSRPTAEEIVDELLWVIDRAEEHLGRARAARYLRKFYPWYLERLGVGRAEADAFQRPTTSTRSARWSARSARRAPACEASTSRLSRRYLKPAYGRCYSSAPPSPRCAPRAGSAIGRFSVFGGARAAPPGSETEEGSTTVARESLITPEGLEKLKEELERAADRRAGARSPSGSRRRASSATSPRTPSTTTPRTSRRCSSSGSRRWRSGSAARPSSTPRTLDTERRRRRRQGPRQGPEDRRLAEVPARRLRRGEPLRGQALPRVADRHGR